MYNYNNKNSSTVEIKMVFPQRSPHHQQKQGHQHKSERTGYCAQWSGDKRKPILGQKQAINFRTILDPTLLKKN